MHWRNSVKIQDNGHNVIDHIRKIHSFVQMQVGVSMQQVYSINAPILWRFRLHRRTCSTIASEGTS